MHHNLRSEWQSDERWSDITTRRPLEFVADAHDHKPNQPPLHHIARQNGSRAKDRPSKHGRPFGGRVQCPLRVQSGRFGPIDAACCTPHRRLCRAVPHRHAKRLNDAAVLWNKGAAGCVIPVTSASRKERLVGSGLPHKADLQYVNIYDAGTTPPRFPQIALWPQSITYIRGF